MTATGSRPSDRAPASQRCISQLSEITQRVTAKCERVQWRTVIKNPQRGFIVLSKGLLTHIQKTLGLPSHDTQNKSLSFCALCYLLYCLPADKNNYFQSIR